MTPPDEALLEQARSGDRSALDQLLRHEQERVLAFALRLCGDGERAREVAQESLLAAARTARTFRGEAAAIPMWLYAIARSFCLKLQRTRKSAPARLESVEGSARAEVTRVPDPGPLPEDQALRAELRAALEEELAALPPRYAEVLELCVALELSAADAARALGVSVDTVKSRLHRARVMMRDRMCRHTGLCAEEDER
jgi:RNA polymerase sigma-70 factor (ECF subfamily)